MDAMRGEEEPESEGWVRESAKHFTLRMVTDLALCAVTLQKTRYSSARKGITSQSQEFFSQSRDE